MRIRARLGVFVVCAVTCLAGSALGQSAADLETARDLFKQANDLHDKGDKQGALVKYKAAHELANTPITGLELGKAYAELKMFTEAREVLLEVDKIPVKPHDSEKVTRARTDAKLLADEVHAKIPALTILIDNLPSGATASVNVDGAALPAATLGVERKLNPGSHTILVGVEGGPTSSSTVVLGEGESRTLHLSVQLPPPPPTTTPETVPPITAPPVTHALQPTYVTPVDEAKPPPVTPTTGGGGGAVTAAWIFGGVGLATWLVTAITGGLALGKKSDVESHCNPTTKTCDQTGLDAASSGGTLATVSTVTAVVGAVFITTAIVIGIAAPKSSGGAALKAAFVLTPQPNGGMLGLHLRY